MFYKEISLLGEANALVLKCGFTWFTVAPQDPAVHTEFALKDETGTVLTLKNLPFTTTESTPMNSSTATPHKIWLVAGGPINIAYKR